jgi:hypothetical protein
VRFGRGSPLKVRYRRWVQAGWVGLARLRVLKIEGTRRRRVARARESSSRNSMGRWVEEARGTKRVAPTQRGKRDSKMKSTKEGGVRETKTSASTTGRAVDSIRNRWIVADREPAMRFGDDVVPEVAAM